MHAVAGRAVPAAGAEFAGFVTTRAEIEFGAQGVLGSDDLWQACGGAVDVVGAVVGGDLRVERLLEHGEFEEGQQRREGIGAERGGGTVRQAQYCLPARRE